MTTNRDIRCMSPSCNSFATYDVNVTAIVVALCDKHTDEAAGEPYYKSKTRRPHIEPPIPLISSSITGGKVELIVTVSLDPIPGGFHTVESAKEAIRGILNNMIPHYNPEVEINDFHY